MLSKTCFFRENTSILLNPLFQTWFLPNLPESQNSICLMSWGCDVMSFVLWCYVMWLFLLNDHAFSNAWNIYIGSIPQPGCQCKIKILFRDSRSKKMFHVMSIVVSNKSASLGGRSGVSGQIGYNISTKLDFPERRGFPETSATEIGG